MPKSGKDYNTHIDLSVSVVVELIPVTFYFLRFGKRFFDELRVTNVFCITGIATIVTIDTVEKNWTDDGKFRLELFHALVHEVLPDAAPVSCRGVDVCAIEEIIVKALYSAVGYAHTELLVFE